MWKLSQTDRSARTPKQKRRTGGSSKKYLKPGALAQLRYSKALATKSCTDPGKKRVAVVDGVERDSDAVFLDMGTPVILSHEKFGYGSLVGPLDLLKQNNLQRTPKTPRTDGCESESRLESLPLDLLVNILCSLHHDQLKAAFHISQRIRKATVIARQFHFNYTTPCRSRQEMLRTMTPVPTERWPFVSKDGKNVPMPIPNTPKAPKHGPRPPSRVKFTEMRQITAVLFQEAAIPARCNVPSVIAKPFSKPFASHRVLFYEDELCKAVAQNKLC